MTGYVGDDIEQRTRAASAAAETGGCHIRHHAIEEISGAKQ